MGQLPSFLLDLWRRTEHDEVVSELVTAIREYEQLGDNLLQRFTDSQAREKELKDLWDEISSELSAICQGRCDIPSVETTFGAAFEIDDDQQKVDAMILIQDTMRDRKTGEAVAVFRTARKRWPNRKEFGSADISPADEFIALKEIFMSSLHSEAGTEPRKENTIEEQYIQKLQKIRRSTQAVMDRQIKKSNYDGPADDFNGYRGNDSSPSSTLVKKRIEHANKYTQTEMKPSNVPFMIQIYYLHKGGTIQKIEEELKEALKSQCHASIDFTNRRQHSHIDSSQILIVLSIQTSRTGADAENAIKDIKNHSNAALVMLHREEIHALPIQSSTEILTDPMFEDFGGIFDLAFTTERGIYQCILNDDALKGICKFIMKTPHQLHFK